MKRDVRNAVITASLRSRWVQGPNDYASMEEVLTRRFTHGGVSGEFDSFAQHCPDLIIDGRWKRSGEYCIEGAGMIWESEYSGLRYGKG